MNTCSPTAPFAPMRSRFPESDSTCSRGGRPLSMNRFPSASGATAGPLADPAACCWCSSFRRHSCAVQFRWSQASHSSCHASGRAASSWHTRVADRPPAGLQPSHSQLRRWRWATLFAACTR